MEHRASGHMVRLGNMHSAASKKRRPMPDKLDRRNRFKKTLLVKAMELTHAFAPPQGIRSGNVEPRSATVVAGDFNMPIGLVDEALREMHSGVTWQVSDSQPNGNRDFMFSAGVDLTKIETFKRLSTSSRCIAWLRPRWLCQLLRRVRLSLSRLSLHLVPLRHPRRQRHRRRQWKRLARGVKRPGGSCSSW